MACTAYLVCLIGGHSKKRQNALGRCCNSRGLISKLEQSMFFRYQWFNPSLSQTLQGVHALKYFA
jgi:hypothetical protein